MASSKCSLSREVANLNKNMDDAVKEATITEADLLGLKDIVEDVEAELQVRRLVGEIVPEEEIEEYILNKYGEHGPRYLLAVKINALIAGNPIIADMVHEMIIEFMPSGVTPKGELIRVPGFAGLDKGLSKEEQMLRTLKVQSISTLKVIYEEAFGWANAGMGTNWGKGVVGNLVTQYFVPKQVAKKERTGAYFTFAHHMRRYYTNIEENIGSFMYDRVVTKEKADGTTVTTKFRGMQSILSDIEGMAELLDIKMKKEDLRTPSELMMEFFVMNMVGEVIINKNGDFIAYDNYGAVRNDDGTWKMHDEENLVHDFQTPISIDKFQNGRYDFKLNKTQIKKFKKLLKEAREIDNRLFKFSKSQFAKSVKLLKKSIRQHFPDLSDSDVELLFFEDWKVKQHKDLLDRIKKLDKINKTDNIGRYNKFKDTFGKYASLNMYLNQSNDAEYKENHFPIRYPKQTFMLMWDAYIMELNQRLEDATEAKDIESLKNQLNRAIEIQENKENGYTYDTVSDKEIPFARDHRHLRRITNAFDVRMMRKDSGVYYDYLHDIFASIERNLLTVTLLNSMAMTDSEAVHKTLINYYKVPFNDPSVEGGFSFLKTSDEGIAGMLGNVGFNVSPETVNRAFRRFNRWLTAGKLGGISTSVVNRMAILHTMVDRNLAEISKVGKIWSANKVEVDAFLAKINVAAFQDFFSKSLVNGKAGMELDNFTAEQIYAVMLNYPATKENFKEMTMSKLRSLADKVGVIHKKLSKDALVDELAKAEMSIQFRKILENSPNVRLKIKRINSKKEIQKRLKEIRKDKIDSMLNKFVEFSLTQEFEINRYRTIFNWRYQPPGMIYKGFSHIFKGLQKGAQLSSKLRGEYLSMSGGEAWIRSTAAIAGILSAQNLGYIRSDVNFWELSGDDFRQASEIAKLISEFSNMGLSTTDIGSAGYGGFGSIMQKFNVWAMQRRGREHRMIKYMYLIEKDLNKLGKTRLFDGKALSKMLGKAIKEFLTSGPKAYNKMNVGEKQRAHFLKFLWTGVMPALFLDLIVWGPLGNLAFMKPIKAIGRVGGFATAMRGLPSQTARLFSLPIALAIRYSLGMLEGDEEEEELERFAVHYLREMPFGFGVSWTFDQILLLYYIFSERTTDAVVKGVDVMSPAIPTIIDNTPTQILKAVGKEISKED